MSVCIEQTHFKNNQFSQSYPVCDEKILPQSNAKESVMNNAGFGQIKVWIERSRQRKSLATLDERMLSDIGFTATQAREEFSKPFWK